MTARNPGESAGQPEVSGGNHRETAEASDASDAPECTCRSINVSRAEQVAARLMAGSGLCALSAQDYDHYQDVGPSVHGSVRPYAAGQLATADSYYVVTNPAVDSAWRSVSLNHSVDIAMMIEERAPVVDMTVYLSDVRIWGRAIHRDVSAIQGCDVTSNLRIALEELPQPQLWQIEPQRVHVHCQAGAADVTTEGVRQADADPIAAHQYELIQAVTQFLGRSIRDLVQYHMLLWPQEYQQELRPCLDPRVVGLDSHGMTLVIFTPSAAQPLRIPFDEPVATWSELTTQLKLRMPWSGPRSTDPFDDFSPDLPH